MKGKLSPHPYCLLSGNVSTNPPTLYRIGVSRYGTKGFHHSNNMASVWGRILINLPLKCKNHQPHSLPTTRQHSIRCTVVNKYDYSTNMTGGKGCHFYSTLRLLPRILLDVILTGTREGMLNFYYWFLSFNQSNLQQSVKQITQPKLEIPTIDIYHPKTKNSDYLHSPGTEY